MATILPAYDVAAIACVDRCLVLHNAHDCSFRLGRWVRRFFEDRRRVSVNRLDQSRLNQVGACVAT